MLKLKLQYFGHLMWTADSLERPWCWKRSKAGREGDDRGWDGCIALPTQWTWLWANSGRDEGQGSLACCSPWGCNESDTTERLNNKERGFLTLALSIHSGCYNKRTTDWVAYKQQTFISRSSGGWEVQDQGISTSSVWWEPASWLIDGPCAHMKNRWGSSLGLLHKDTNPIHKGSTFMI